MWLGLRTWWYGKGFGKAESMPRDVRDNLIRLCLKPVVEKAKTLPPDERNELITKLASNAFNLESSEVSEDMRNELLTAAFELADDAKPLPKPPPWKS